MLERFENTDTMDDVGCEEGVVCVCGDCYPLSVWDNMTEEEKTAVQDSCKSTEVSPEQKIKSLLEDINSIIEDAHIEIAVTSKKIKELLPKLRAT